MGAAGDSPGPAHSFQKFLLIRAGFLTWQLNLDVNSPTIADAVSHHVGLAVVANGYATAICGVEITDGMVSGDAAVLAEGCNNGVL